MHDGGDDEHAGALPLRHRRPGAARASSSRLAEDGELLIRSQTVFAGYYKEPEATAEVLGDDGWLRTGDIAAIDEDGFVTITDRKKDILVTAGGKNIAPQNLENDLKTSRFVSQAIVVGDRKPFPAALITLDPVEIEKWAAEQGIEGDPSSLADDPRVRRARRRRSSRTSTASGRASSRSSGSRSSRATSRWTRGEVTPTLKLRRRVVLDHFADEVDALYDGARGDAAPRDPRTRSVDLATHGRRSAWRV